MKTKSTIFFLAFALCIKINLTHAQVNVQDSLALVNLYDSTNGPEWVNNTNWLSGNPVSTWYGVNEVSNNRVTYIDLSNNNLAGRLPSSIGNLGNLTDLGFSDNHLIGNIPASIGNLVNLRSLGLSNNQLNGIIPTSIGNLVNLRDLGLSDNQLKGNIPPIENLVHLKSLNLSNNELNGSIPSAIGNFLNLEGLYLDHNQLTDTIPSSLSNLGYLRYGVDLSYNQLSGTIPRISLFSQSFGSNSSLSLNNNLFTYNGMESILNAADDVIYSPQASISIHQSGVRKVLRN